MNTSEETSKPNALDTINEFLGLISDTKETSSSDDYMNTEMGDREKVQVLQLLDKICKLFNRKTPDFEIEAMVACIIENGILQKLIDNFIGSLSMKTKNDTANTITNQHYHLYKCGNDYQYQYNSYLQSTFLKCLTDISSSSNENHMMFLIKSQIIENIKHLLLLPMTSDENIDILINIVWTIGNIAGTSSKCVDYILSSCNILAYFIPLKEKCFEILTKHKIDKKKEMIELLDTMAWTLYNCIHGMPDEAAAYGLSFVLSCIEYLTSLIKGVKDDVYDAQDIISHSVWALIRITESQTAQMQKICIFDKMKQCDTIQWLVNHLNNKCHKIECIVVMHNITSIIITKHDQVQYVLNCGLFKQLFQSLYQLNENLCQNNLESINKCLCIINDIIIVINNCDVIFESGLLPTIAEFMIRGLSYRGDKDETSNQFLCEINSNVNRNDKNCKIIKPLSVLDSKLEILITGFIRMNLNTIEYGKKISPNDISSVAINCFDSSNNGFDKFYSIRKIACDIISHIIFSQVSFENLRYLVEECNIVNNFCNLLDLSKIDLKNEEMEMSHCNLINDILASLDEILTMYEKQDNSKIFDQCVKIFMAANCTTKIGNLLINNDLSMDIKQEAHTIINHIIKCYKSYINAMEQRFNKLSMSM